MKLAFDIIVGICALLIAYAYPFIAVIRGQSIGDATGKSWGMQVVYFIGLCFGVPALAGFFDVQIGDTLTDWVPDTPGLVPVMLCGWMGPLFAGWIASRLRHDRHWSPPQS